MHFKGFHTVRSHILKAMDQNFDCYKKSKKEKWETAMQDETVLDAMFYEATFQNSIKYPSSQKAKALSNMIQTWSQPCLEQGGWPSEALSIHVSLRFHKINWRVGLCVYTPTQTPSLFLDTLDTAPLNTAYRAQLQTALSRADWLWHLKYTSALNLCTRTTEKSIALWPKWGGEDVTSHTYQLYLISEVSSLSV